MDYRKMDEYYEKLCKELDNQLGKELTGQQLDTMQKLTATIHFLDKMMAEEDEYSGRYNDRSYRDHDRSYRDDRSMRRGRGADGRYVSRNYSRGGDFEAELHELMENAPTEDARQSIKRMLDNMR